jgi:hypothetical protein
MPGTGSIRPCRNSSRCRRCKAQRRVPSRFKKILMAPTRPSLSYMARRKSHETSDNRTGSSLHTHKHVSAGASAWTGWLWNSHSSVSRLVHRSGGYNECTPDLEQHRSRSGRADHPHSSAIVEYAAAHDTVVRRSQVKKPRGLFDPWSGMSLGWCASGSITSPSPRSSRGEGWGEGLLRSIRSRGESPSPGLLRNPTSPRKRGEVDRPASYLVLAGAALAGAAFSGTTQELSLPGPGLMVPPRSAHSFGPSRSTLGS